MVSISHMKGTRSAFLKHRLSRGNTLPASQLTARALSGHGQCARTHLLMRLLRRANPVVSERRARFSREIAAQKGGGRQGTAAPAHGFCEFHRAALNFRGRTKKSPYVRCDGLHQNVRVAGEGQGLLGRRKSLWGTPSE